MTKTKSFLIGITVPFIIAGISFCYQTIMLNISERNQLKQTLSAVEPLQQSIEQNITFLPDSTANLPNHHAYANTPLPPYISLAKIYSNGDIILLTQDNLIMRLRPEQKDGRIHWTCLASQSEVIPSHCNL